MLARHSLGEGGVSPSPTLTTGWHLPRAAWLFQKAGVAFTAFPVDFRRNPRPLTPLDFLPKADDLKDTETALREIYGNLFYRLFR